MLEGPGTEDGSFADSVLPVMAAGQAELVENDFAIDDHFILDIHFKVVLLIGTA